MEIPNPSAPCRATRVVGWLALWGIVLLGAPGVPAAEPVHAPEYALSGRTEALAQTVLAHGPRGAISAFDALAFDAMTSRSLGDIPIEHWLEPRSPAAEASQPRMRAAVERLAVYAELAARAGTWQPAEDHLRAMSYGAAEAAWIHHIVLPQVVVRDADINRYYLAHAERYLQRPRVQVRYIFRPVDSADSAASAAERRQLELLAERLRAGEEDFAEAARRVSRAESAPEGGLLPPFEPGTFARTFEERAFQLTEPGQMSPVFEGPGGWYLIQLVRRWPPRNVPIGEVAGEIREQLRYDHVRHFYAFELQALREREFVRDNAPYWDYLDAEAPVAQVGTRTLNRLDLLRFFGNPLALDQRLRTDLILRRSAAWIEGELVLGDLERRGMDRHVWIARARELAAIALAARHTMTIETPVDAYATLDAARAALESAPSYTARLRSTRLIRFDVTPRIDPSMPPSQARRAERLAQSIDASIARGTLPAEPDPVVLGPRVMAVAPGDELAFRELVNGLTRVARESKWPDVDVAIADAGWQPIVPGGAWWDWVGSTPRGNVGALQRVGAGYRRYLVVMERPLPLASLQTQAMLFKSLAFDALMTAIFERERDTLRRSGRLRYEF